MKKEISQQAYQALSDFLRNEDEEREGLADLAITEQLVKQDLQKETDKWSY